MDPSIIGEIESIGGIGLLLGGVKATVPGQLEEVQKVMLVR